MTLLLNDAEHRETDPLEQLEQCTFGALQLVPLGHCSPRGKSRGVVFSAPS